MKNNAIVASACLLVLALAQPGRAQISISPFAGGMIYDGSVMVYEEGAYQESAIDSDPPVPVLGLRVGYGFANGIDLEVSYGTSWLENSRGNVSSHLYQASLRYPVISSAAWVLHLAAGAGGITYTMDGVHSSSLSDPAISGGAGVSYRLSRRLDLRTDLTFMGQLCHEPEQQDGLICNDGSQLGYTQLAAGVRFRL